MASIRSFFRTPHVYLVLLGTFLLALPFHLRPDNYIVDDGYFYPQIARFIAQGAGSTFSGIMPTNGYHPLWMLVAVAVASVTSASESMVQILGAIQDLLLLLCLLALLAIAQVHRMRGALLACIPLLFMGMVLGIWRLLETTLSLTLQVATLLALLPLLPWVFQRCSGRWRSLILGVLLGLAMLARLDLLFFSIVMLSYQILVARRPAAIASILLQGCIAGAFVVPYLLWNWSHFHHLLPISGAIKSTFPHRHAWAVAPFMYPVFCSLLFNAFLLLKRRKTTFETAGILLAIITALQMAYSLSYGELAPWYLTTGYLGVAFSILWISDACLRRVPRLAWVETALGSVLLVGFFLLGVLRLETNFTYTRFLHHQVKFQGAYTEPKHALANQLSAALPKGSRIFLFDAPGGIALYSGMSILPADGLVADYAYNSDIVRNGFCSYAATHGIRYFITPYLQPGQVYDRLDLTGKGGVHEQNMTIVAPLTHKPAGNVILRDADFVLQAREINPELEASMPIVGVWRIHPEVPANCP